jgi:hypothetical protein
VRLTRIGVFSEERPVFLFACALRLDLIGATKSANLEIGDPGKICTRLLGGLDGMISDFAARHQKVTGSQNHGSNRAAPRSCRSCAADATLMNRNSLLLRGTRTETALSDGKPEETFRVVDRRLFTAEGEVRDEVAREERRREEARGAAAAAPAVESSASKAQPATTAVSPNASVEAQPAAPAEPAANEPKASRGLEMLVNFVAQNAAMLLGAYPDPRTGQGMVDLEGAREMIDMLDALVEATHGNINSEDRRLLLDVVGSLKLSFMEVTKAAAKAMQEKAKARP